MNRTKIWKYLTIFVATYLMLSVAPEIRLFGIIIDAIGFDVIILLIGAQIIVTVTLLYHGKLKPLLNWLNAKLEMLDPLYFIPSWRQLKAYPPIIFHAFPFLVGLSFIIFAHASLYS